MMFAGFRWSKHRRATHASGAGVDVEVTAKFLVTRFWIFERTEVLFDVGDRTEQALLFTAPQRDANRATRLNAECFQNSRGFHHDRAADRVVSRACRCVPRIEVATEHDHFVGFIGAANLADRVV